jgi:mRNA interferase YafQ
MLKPVRATQFKNHPLKSNWKGFLECHIEPDWLLIYRLNEDKEVLELARTGSHSELF